MATLLIATGEAKKKKKTLEYAGVKYMGNKSVISFYVWKLYGKVSQESRV